MFPLSLFSQIEEESDSIHAPIERTQAVGCEDFYDDWLADNCGNGMFIFNGDFSNPIAQNPNPSGGEVWLSCMWNTYTAQSGYTGNMHIGTPDLYMPQGNFVAANLGVPVNISGSQADNTPGGGSGYMGIYTYLPGYNGTANSNYREYVISNFGFDLVPGTAYNITFYTSLADNSEFATPVQAWIGQSVNFPAIANNSVAPVPFTTIAGQTQVYTSPVVNNANNPTWFQHTFTFTPSVANPNIGPYYLVIGSFQPNPAIPIQNPIQAGATPYVSPFTVPYGGNYAYYFIDDISVVGQTCCASNRQFLDDDLDITVANTDILWSTSAPSTVMNETIYVNGILHINTNVVIDHCTIKFSPNSGLIVDAGVTLDIKNGSRLEGCPQMWNGILASASTQTTVNISYSKILDATTGLLVIGNQKISLKSSEFNNNERAVTFFGFSGPAPVFEKNLFTTTAPGLKAPLAGTFGKVGITSAFSNYINITPYFGTPSLKNTFRNLNTGIQVEGSSIQLSNAEFKNIGIYNNVNAYAVKTFNGGTTLRSLDINNNFGPVDIKSCKNGIFVMGNVNPYIHHVNINGSPGGPFLTERAIWMTLIPPFSTPSASYHGTIQQNTIRNATYGVGAYLCNETKLLIEKNDIRNHLARANSYGIYAVNGVLNSKIDPRDCIYYGIDIFENTVQKFQTGINSQTCNCLEVDNNTVEMQNNSAPTQQYHGILTKNCPHSYITNNNILGVFNDWRNIGLRHSLCPESFVSCNVVEKTGYAIWLEQNSDNSRITYNFMEDYDKGIYFTGNCVIGDQKPGPSAHMNGWFKVMPNPNAEFYTEGAVANMSGTTFYFDNDDPDGRTQYTATSVQNLSNLPGNANIPILVNSMNLSNPPGIEANCGVSLPGNWSRFVDRIQTPLAFNVNFPIYTGKNHWLFQNSVLRQLKMHEDTIPFLSIPTNVQDIIDSLDGSACQKILEVEQLLSEKMYTSALSLNSTINPSCMMGNFYAQLNNVLIPYYDAINNFDTIVVPSTDSLYLTEVANLCPWEWGNGVWQARVFLQQHVNNDLTFQSECEVAANLLPRTSEALLNQNNSNHEFIVSIYPNPTDDFVYLTINIEGYNQFQIIDMQGKVWAKGNFEFNQVIATEGLANGIYTISITNEVVNLTKALRLIVNHD